MFEKKKVGVSKQTVITRFVDVPSLYQPTEEGKDFINALHASPNLDLFDLGSI